MTNVQILKEIERIRESMSKCLQKFREHSHTSELEKERDKIQKELDQKVLKSSLSDWSLGKDGNIYGVWQEELKMELPPQEKSLKISGDLFTKIKKLFIEEIKQNPRDWHIETEESGDSYFVMWVLKHKSGRKHYQPRLHHVWESFSIEEWKDIQKALNNQDNRESFPKIKENEKKNIGQLLGYSQEKNEEEKVEEILNKFNESEYNNWTHQELMEGIKKEKLNNISLQKLVSQLKTKVRELEQEITELKAQTPQTQEVKQEIQKRESQLRQARVFLNSYNNNPKPFPYLPVLGTVGIVALLGGLMAYQVRKNKIKK